MPLVQRNITVSSAKIPTATTTGGTEDKISGAEPSIFEAARMLATLSAYASEILQSLAQELTNVDIRVKGLSSRVAHAKEKQIPHMESMETRSKQVTLKFQIL